MIPKYLKEKRIKKKSIQKEKWIVKKILVPASGALWHSKGDFNIDDFLIEGKSTIKKCKKESKITEKMLRKIWQQAGSAGKTPLMMFVFEEYFLIGEVRMIDRKGKRK